MSLPADISELLRRSTRTMRAEGKGYLGEASGINPRVCSPDHNTYAPHSFACTSRRNMRTCTRALSAHALAYAGARFSNCLHCVFGGVRCGCGSCRGLAVAGEAWVGFYLERDAEKSKAHREEHENEVLILCAPVRLVRLRILHLSVDCRPLSISVLNLVLGKVFCRQSPRNFLVSPFVSDKNWIFKRLRASRPTQAHTRDA